MIKNTFFDLSIEMNKQCYKCTNDRRHLAAKILICEYENNMFPAFMGKYVKILSIDLDNSLNYYYEAISTKLSNFNIRQYFDWNYKDIYLNGEDLHHWLNSNPVEISVPINLTLNGIPN